jgi:hypothetical protein
MVWAGRLRIGDRTASYRTASGACTEVRIAQSVGRSVPPRRACPSRLDSIVFVDVERIPSLHETSPLRCARYVRLYGQDGGPCDREAIAIVDGVLVCYVHAPVEARHKPTGR